MDQSRLFPRLDRHGDGTITRVEAVAGTGELAAEEEPDAADRAQEEDK